MASIKICDVCGSRIPEGEHFTIFEEYAALLSDDKTVETDWISKHEMCIPCYHKVLRLVDNLKKEETDGRKNE